MNKYFLYRDAWQGLDISTKNEPKQLHFEITSPIMLQMQFLTYVAEISSIFFTRRSILQTRMIHIFLGLVSTHKIKTLVAAVVERLLSKALTSGNKNKPKQLYFEITST
jgi:hypothetical protein